MLRWSPIIIPNILKEGMYSKKGKVGGIRYMKRVACGAHLRLLGPWAWGGLLLRPG